MPYHILLCITVFSCFTVFLDAIRIRKLKSELICSKKQYMGLMEEFCKQNIQLEAVISSISDRAVLSISDNEGNFLYYSKSANSYFPRNANEMKAGATYKKGLYYNKDGSEIELCDLPVFRVLKGETVSDYHFVVKGPGSEEETHFLFNGSPIYDKNGCLKYGVYFSLDITEHVLHRRLVPIAEQLAAENTLKDKLFSIIIHDIRSPMATMVNLIELLEENLIHCDSENMEIIRSVKKQINHSFDIVEKLLEWLISQKERQVYTPMDCGLTEIIGDVIPVYHISACTKDIKILADISEDLHVWADREMLEFILRNLISNAVKYTDRGGLITISVRKEEDKAVIAVKDTGTGIADEKIKTLFCGGYADTSRGTAGEKGIGLGLTLCKEFVSQNGGDIWVDSMPGKGSTFFFTLLIPE